MKAIHRISSALKAAGIVLILIAIVLGLYALLNTGAGWSSMTEEMAKNGLKTGAIHRFIFDDHYLSAMSKASTTREQNADSRREALRPFFSAWFSRMEQAQAEAEAQIVSENVTRLQTDMDWDAYRERLNNMEEMRESQEIREILEYVNSMATPPKKGKLNNLQAASQEPLLQEQYAALREAYGEEAGSWYEFMHVLYAMLQEDGGTRDLKTWFAEDMTVERYQTGLDKMRREGTSMTADSFSETLRVMLEGEQTDFEALLDNAAATLNERYPGQSLGGSLGVKTVLAEILPELLLDEGFDGSWGALADALRAAARENQTVSIASWEAQYLEEVNEEADKRASIGAVTVFWGIAAKYALMILTGIVLVVLSRFLRWAVTKRLLATRKTAGIQEDPDVLLRVEHLKQYFRSGDAVTKAVDDISFFIRKGEVFGLVGESGCGKTTTGRTIINLYDPTEGDIYFQGLRISSMQNGLPVLKAQIRNEYAEKVERLKKQGRKEEIKALKKEKRERLRKADTEPI